MSNWKYELGDRVKDRVSGFTGIVTSRVEHLNGCRQYGVNPPIQDGKMVDGYNIDEQQLELVDKGLNKTQPVPKSDTGGPMSVISPNRL